MSPPHTIALLFFSKSDRRLLGEFIESLGHRVRSPEPHRMPSLDWGEIGVVISDERSAHQWGEMLVREKKCSEVFIALLIAMKKKSAISRWLEFGYDDALPMPLTKAELGARLTTFLRIREQSYELKQRREAIFKALTDSSSDHIFMLDRHGIFLASNNKMISFAAGSTDSLVGGTLRDAYSPALSSDLYKMMKKVYTFKRAVTFERVVPGKEANTWVQYTLYPIMEGDTVQAVGGIGRDVTSLKLAEATATKALREKESLLRELYHRTKNNMQVIIAMLDLHSQAVKNGEVLQVFREVENRIKSMSLVHQKLYEARDLSSIEMASYTRDLVELLVRSYKEKSQVITTNLDLERVTVNIDVAIPYGLVINELISNCFKHAFNSQETGVVTIRLRLLGGGEIELCLADDGAGMPDNFDIRESSSLGLQSVIALVEHQLRGIIEMRSNGGTEIVIRFQGLKNDETCREQE